MANKWDLKSWTVPSAASGTMTNIGGAIAQGKKRFLTYIRVEKVTPVGSGCGTAVGVQIASQTTATTPTSATVSAGRLLPIMIPKVSAVTTVGNYPQQIERAIPATPSMDHPIIGVTGSGWMSVWTSGAACGIFATYYDE